MPSSLAWYRVFGLDPNEMLSDCFVHRYASVFILDPLPFQTDDERIGEVAAIRKHLNTWQIRDFTSLDYNVVKVPVLPVEERVVFVLERLSKCGFPGQGGLRKRT
jgi:predicted ATPase